MKPPVARSARKPKGQGHERREEILAAALALFSQQGLQSVSTRQIAQAAGISQPALYAYFATKDDIAAELCTRAFAVLTDRMHAVRLTQPQTAEGFEETLKTYVDFAIANPDAYRVAFMLENTDNALRHEAKTQSASAGQEAFEAFLSIVSDFHALGLSASGDLMLTAQTLWAGLHGLVALLIARPAFSWVERDLLIAAHVRMLRRGALR